MTGTQFLIEALKLYPDARRVLLTAYADTETAITAINQIGLDHYLLKPWEPPEQRLYPVLDDLLADWMAQARPPFEGIRVAGTALSACELRGQGLPVAQPGSLPVGGSRCRRVRARARRIDARRHVAAAGRDVSGRHDDGAADAAGSLPKRSGCRRVRSGPSTTSSSWAAARRDWRRRCTPRPRGCARSSWNAMRPADRRAPARRSRTIWAFRAASPARIWRVRATTQAKRFGAEIVSAQDVTCIRRNDPYRVVVLSDGSELNCNAVLIASGMEVRRLEAPGVAELVGVGVYYGAALSEAVDVPRQARLS